MFKLARIFTFYLSIFTPLLVSADSKCFDLKYRDEVTRIVIERDTEASLELKLQGKEKLSLEVQCLGKGEELKCLGDDDSASFTINFIANKIEVDHLTFGEPDTATKSFIFLKKAGEFELKTCSP